MYWGLEDYILSSVSGCSQDPDGTSCFQEESSAVRYVKKKYIYHNLSLAQNSPQTQPTPKPRVPGVPPNPVFLQTPCSLFSPKPSVPPNPMFLVFPSSLAFLQIPHSTSSLQTHCSYVFHPNLAFLQTLPPPLCVSPKPFVSPEPCIVQCVNKECFMKSKYYQETVKTAVK